MKFKHIFHSTLSAIMLGVFCFVSLTLTAAKKKTVKPIKVACVGNSITYGTGIKDREHFSYPVQLQKMLGDKYEVANFGKPGATLLYHGHRPYVQQKEFKEALAFKGDIAVIHLGINDTDPRNWPNYRDEFVKDYLSIMDSLRCANPKVRFILARMTPIADRHPRFISGTKLWHDEIQDAIETVARISGAELIDFHAPLYPYPNLLPDAIHPNAEGAGILAKTVYGGITGNYGGLKLSNLYTDYMVLQRDMPLDIHGTANTGEKVTVSIAGQKLSTVANNRGEWSVTLQPLSVSENQTLTIEAGKQKKVFKHVAVGEVWLCSGQSNMAFMLFQAATGKRDIPQANDPNLRLYDMKGRWETYDVAWPASCLDSLNHLQYFEETTWKPSTPETASEFSAVAYYYGKMLRNSLKVPVGLICNAIGGAPIESWIDRNTLETQFPAILKDWLDNDFIQDWVRGRADKNLSNDTTGLGRHPYEPCYLYESGILPLQQYPIKGVIWYQGESNAHNMEAHEQLFHLLVNSWRTNWKNPQMPFYFVQLSSLNRPSWTWFRDSQLRLMKDIPNTGMAVSSDCGDSLNVHPNRKQPVGERLARWALNKTYGHQLTPSGPIYNKVIREGEALVVSFDYGKGLRTSDGKAPSCFEIAEEDGMFYPAAVTIEGDKVRLTSSHVKKPRLVRYAWQPFTRANLVNEDGLPASTFRGEVSMVTPAADSLVTASILASDVLFSKDSAQYRIPAIVECKSGKLIAFTDHRYDGADIGWGNHLDIVMKTSKDGGKTWTPNEQMVAQGGGHVETDFHCGHGDAAVVVDRKSGEILVMCASGGISYWDSNRDKPIMMGRYYSKDEGKTWQGEEVTRQIYDLMPEVTGAFFTSGRIVQSSRIKVGSHYRIYSVLATKQGNRVLYSDDFGKTWGVLGALSNAAAAAPKGDEAKVEELPNGNVLLSSRVGGGRYFNIYSYDNTKTATGKWGEVVYSSAENKGIAASSNACNGELVLAKALKNGKKTYLLLQSVPLGPGRSKVAIFYKELKTPADYASPQAIATNWQGSYQVSNTESAYSTMIQDRKGDILFLMEENFLTDHYDIVFDKLTISEITAHQYK